jgi:hypothetical protein
MLNLTFIGIFGTTKAILGYKGMTRDSTTMEWILGVMLAILSVDEYIGLLVLMPQPHRMYYFSFYEEIYPPVSPWFFHRRVSPWGSLRRLSPWGSLRHLSPWGSLRHLSKTQILLLVVGSLLGEHTS